MTQITAQAGDEDDFELELEGDEGTVVEEIDDTPEADRGREPMPKDIVEELEADELEEYSDKVKTRLKQMKKVWHDERREKERMLREREEAVAASKALMEEKRRLESILHNGEKDLLDSYKRTTDYELEAARRSYKEAYDNGNVEEQLKAQEALSAAQYRKQQLDQYKPSRQAPDDAVDVPSHTQAPEVPRPDTKTLAWQERNTWYGADPEMTASALGLHQRLINERGPQFAGSDDYWTTIDKTMRRRFPEYFGESEKPAASQEAARGSKPAAVVAPASRSRSPKKIALTSSQIAIAKRLGLTNEQYAREVAKAQEN